MLPPNINLGSIGGQWNECELNNIPCFIFSQLVYWRWSYPPPPPGPYLNFLITSHQAWLSYSSLSPAIILKQLKNIFLNIVFSFDQLLRNTRMHCLLGTCSRRSKGAWTWFIVNRTGNQSYLDFSWPIPVPLKFGSHDWPRQPLRRSLPWEMVEPSSQVSRPSSKQPKIGICRQKTEPKFVRYISPWENIYSIKLRPKVCGQESGLRRTTSYLVRT